MRARGPSRGGGHRERVFTPRAMSCENPLGQGSGGVEAVNIEAGLKDGSISPEDAVLLMQEQLRQMVSKKQVVAMLGELRAELGGPAAPAEAAIRTVVAQLTEAPTNWHQGVLYGLVTRDPQDVELRQWAPLGYAVSWIIVFMQSAVAVGLFMGTMTPTCATNDHCISGMYCRVDWPHCDFCGNRVPLAMEIEGVCAFSGEDSSLGLLTVEDATCTTLNNPMDPNFAGFNSTGIAAVCDDPRLSTNMATVEMSENILPWCDVWCEIGVTALSSSLLYYSQIASCPWLHLASFRQPATSTHCTRTATSGAILPEWVPLIGSRLCLPPSWCPCRSITSSRILSWFQSQFGKRTITSSVDGASRCCRLTACGDGYSCPRC